MASPFVSVLQGPLPGPAPATHLLRQADGSTQAVPRIIIRTTTPPSTSTAPAPLQHSPPSQQGGYPAVLSSRVVRDSTTDPPTSAGLPHSFAHWAAPEQQQQRHTLSQYGMHQYQEQQPRSTGHALQPLGQAPHAHVSLAQHQRQPPQQLQYVPQQEQLQGQQLPRPGSFQELLSTPLVPEQYSGAPATHDAASRHTPAAATGTQQQASFAQPAAVYASQVLRQPSSSAVDTGQLAQNPGMAHNPGMANISNSNHMFLQQRGDIGQQQQQQQLGALPYAVNDRPLSSQLLMQTSSAMYPPIQYPQAVGAFPVLPKTSAGPMSPGHPYHGYHTSQAAGSVTGPLQLEQQPQLLTHQQQSHQQQQQQQHLFQPFPQAQPELASLPRQSALHQQQQQQSAVHHRAMAPAAGFASPARQQMAQVCINGVTYDPPQRLGQPPPASNPLAAFPARPEGHFFPSHLSSFHHSSQQSDESPQQSLPPSQHGHPARNPSVTDPRDMCYPPQHGADVATARGGSSGGLPWGSVQGLVPGPTYSRMEQVGGPSPAGSAGDSANQQQMSGLLLLLGLQTSDVVLPA